MATSEPSPLLLPAACAAAAGAAVLLIGHERRRRDDAIAFASEKLCEPCADDEEQPAAAAAQKAPMRRGHAPPESPPMRGSAPARSEEPLEKMSLDAAAPTPRTALLGDEQQTASVGFTKDSASGVRRETYIDWHDYFMSVATLSAYRSKDPSRQVGACIVDPATKRIVGIGYNGFPWGCSDEVLPWARKADSWLDTKYPYVCHAELNAIMNKNTASLEGCRIYTTLFPCNECAKLIVQSRMREVVYLSDAQRNTDPNTASRRILALAGIEAWQHTPAVRRVVIDFDDDLAK